MMCPRADLRLYGRRLLNDREQIHHAQYRGYDIRVIGIQATRGWTLGLRIFHQGKRLVRYRQDSPLYLDFEHARIAGLLRAYEIIERRLSA
ncbi:hypothetical protein [Herbaspirillum frisingense]|uniref:hypothetical protein n=1 Tax=Herbaspirillum frisingense TaxID=92645 RepID=UPI001F38BDFD|nr:hypothetical protein [Herbaspirillum frisingense]